MVHFYGDGRIGPVDLDAIYEIEQSTEEIKRCLGMPKYKKQYSEGIREVEKAFGVPEYLSITKNLH